MTETRLIGSSGILLLVLVLGLTTYLVMKRRSRNGKAHTDDNAEQLYRDISEKLSKVLEVAPEEILGVLKNSDSGKTGNNSKIPLRLECIFKKLSPINTVITINAVYIKSNTPFKTSLTRELSWDQIPSDVRREFIHSRKIELVYVLGDPEMPE